MDDYIDCDDLPAEFVRKLYGFNDDVKLWSRQDALKNENKVGRKKKVGRWSLGNTDTNSTT